MVVLVFSFFCVFVRRCVMLRKGWSVMETPAGWCQVFRGPKAEQWLRRKPWGSSSWQSWGQRRAQEPQSLPVRRRWLRHRVECLENALQALGETESPVAQGLNAALKEARLAAQGRPLAVQLTKCQAFIQRSQNRLRQMEEEQVVEKKALDGVLARLSRLREEMARNPDVQLCRGPPIEIEIGRVGVRTRCFGEEARPFFVGAFFRYSSGEPEPQRVGESSDFGQSISNDADNDRQRKFSGHCEQSIQPSRTVRILNNTYCLRVSWRGQSPGSRSSGRTAHRCIGI